MRSHHKAASDESTAQSAAFQKYLMASLQCPVSSNAIARSATICLAFESICLALVSDNETSCPDWATLGGRDFRLALSITERLSFIYDFMYFPKQLSSVNKSSARCRACSPKSYLDCGFCSKTVTAVASAFSSPGCTKMPASPKASLTPPTSVDTTGLPLNIASITEYGNPSEILVCSTISPES